ncbi:MAG: ABC transporter ATP-binding protein [Blastocatellia bacterium]|nr:ABC transporter ATP-binding protein [Blastocatellia bacterium]
MTEFAIQTTGLHKQFGDKTAVANLTLSVKRGEVFGFLGPNGAGKTTSIKMLLGLVRPTAGSGSVLGAPLGNTAARAKLGFLPEHFRFHDWLTGREFLQFHGKLYGMRGSGLEQRIEQLLVRVDMLDAAHRRLREYSKGMLQRIGLAQALLNEPDLIFLDEPTSGLDPLGRLLVRDIISELRDQGTSVFLNSHLLSEVEITCDRVVFVKRGVVVREVSLGQTDKFLLAELKLDPVTPSLLQKLAQFGSQLTQEQDIIRLQIETESVLADIARWLVTQNVNIYRLTTVKPSLESLFLEVIGDTERPG